MDWLMSLLACTSCPCPMDMARHSGNKICLILLNLYPRLCSYYVIEVCVKNRNPSIFLVLCCVVCTSLLACPRFNHLCVCVLRLSHSCTLRIQWVVSRTLQKPQIIDNVFCITPIQKTTFTTQWWAPFPFFGHPDWVGRACYVPTNQVAFYHPRVAPACMVGIIILLFTSNTTRCTTQSGFKLGYSGPRECRDAKNLQIAMQNQSIFLEKLKERNQARSGSRTIFKNHFQVDLFQTCVYLQ